MPQANSNSSVSNSQHNTTNLYVNTQTLVLLQTTKVQLHNLGDDHKVSSVTVRMIMDCGSLRMYLTSRKMQALDLRTTKSECLSIKTFGTASGTGYKCNVGKFGLKTINGELLKVTALLVPMICKLLTCQPILRSKAHYPHLSGLQLADSADTVTALKLTCFLVWTSTGVL